MIEPPIKTDRPPTLKNLLGPRFSRFLETSDGDSADFSSEFVLFCLTSLCVFWLRTTWFLEVDTQRKLGLFLE